MNIFSMDQARITIAKEKIETAQLLKPFNPSFKLTSFYDGLCRCCKGHNINAMQWITWGFKDNDRASTASVIVPSSIRTWSSNVSSYNHIFTFPQLRVCPLWYIYIHSKQCPCSLKKIPPIHYQSPHSPPIARTIQTTEIT